VKVTGGCHCGAIRFSAKVEPERAAVCHCSDCQVFSGAPYRASVPAPRDGLRWERREPARYSKIADSGNRREQGFCATCGSAIYATSDDGTAPYNLRLGAIDQRAAIMPAAQIWCSSALPWAQDISSLPAYQGNR
jgi:hypothetical protein